MEFGLFLAPASVIHFLCLWKHCLLSEIEVTILTSWLGAKQCPVVKPGLQQKVALVFQGEHSASQQKLFSLRVSVHDHLEFYFSTSGEKKSNKQVKCTRSQKTETFENPGKLLEIQRKILLQGKQSFTMGVDNQVGVKALQVYIRSRLIYLFKWVT